MDKQTTFAGLDTILQGLVDSIDGLQDLVGLFCFLAGVILVFTAMCKIVMLADGRQRWEQGWNSIMWTFLVGCALVSINPFLEAFRSTFLGHGGIDQVRGITWMGYGVAGQMGASNPGQAIRVFHNAAIFIQFVGVISFIRGWFMVKAHADGQRSTSIGAAVTFIVAGAIATNIVGFISVLQSTVGVKIINS